MSLSLNNCTDGKGSGVVFEALSMTHRNLQTLGDTIPKLACFEGWPLTVNYAMKAAMRPRWELLDKSSDRARSIVVGELPPEQSNLARRIVASVNLLEGVEVGALEVMEHAQLSPFRLEQAAERIKELTALVEDLSARLVVAESRIARGPVQADLFGALS